MYRYLKICVLSAIVAVSYSNRMQGVSFWCDKCKKEIKKDSWGRHVFDQHKDDGRRPLLFCEEHNATFEPGAPWEAHLKLDHAGKGWHNDLRSYNLWCNACKRELLVDEWEFHSEIDDKNSIEMYQFVCRECSSIIKHTPGARSEHACKKGCKKNILPCRLLYKDIIFTKDMIFTKESGLAYVENHPYLFSFRCETCNEKVPSGSLKDHICLLCDFWCTLCKERVANGLGYEHIKDKHPNVLNKLFYCKGCSMTAEGWNAHLEKDHLHCPWRGALYYRERGAFYCPGFAGLTKETYEDHSKKIHPGQCVFCKEPVKDEEAREKHMKESHKLSCPICGEKSLDVPLEVHIKRKHEVCEVSKICKVFGVEPDIFKGFAPYCPADFLIEYLLREKLVSECPYHKYYDPGNKTEHYLPFRCDLCKETIEGMYEEEHGEHFKTCKYWAGVCFKKALNDHLKEKHFACEQCNFKCFKTKELLYEHRCAKHTPECIICKKSFETEDLLIQHYGEKHRDNHTCKLCKNSFSSFYLLCDHTKEKHSEQGTMCNYCNRFVHKDERDAKCHRFLHLVKCDQCGEEIIQDGSFGQFGKHIREQHNCTWNCRWDLETLKLQHSGCDHLVPCPVCSGEFVAKDKEKHRNNEHGCDSECPLWKNTKEKEHHFNCALKVFPECPIGGCFEENVSQTHLIKKHGCGPTCRIIIESGKCKIVHIADGKLKEGHDPEECPENHVKEKRRKEEEEKHRKEHGNDCYYHEELKKWICDNNCPLNYPPFTCPVCGIDNADKAHMKEMHCTRNTTCCYQKKGTHIWIHDVECPCWDGNVNDEFNDNENDGFNDNENDGFNDNENDAF